VDGEVAGTGRRLYEAALSRELLLRPIGNTVYFMPPYVIEPAELEWLAARMLQLLEEV
jgi:adenosylmethionine-8-amino-7-oxononanoate aminotransferase